LFEAQAPRPLADRLRPRTLAEVLGQDHLLATDKPIGRMVAARRIASMILWGPPGSGKTTIARLLAEATDLHFEALSAVFSGVADLRRVFEAARGRRQAGQGTLLFIDEIHRFNRAQQDGFLPYVEDGTVTLVGATTENPSFELNAALLSRCQVFVLNRLDDAALEALLARAETVEGRALPVDADARAALRAMADGDGRYVLNLAEELFGLPAGPPLDNARLVAAVQKRAPLYDKAQEGHYNLISALHKSLRGSDADAALYWLARMLAGGGIRATSHAAWSASQSRTSASPIRRHSSKASRRGSHTSGSARPRASWPSRSASSISRPRPSRTPPIGPSAPLHSLRAKRGR
jgi:putative ATPase